MLDFMVYYMEGVECYGPSDSCPMPKSLDRKYDSEHATGHQLSFFKNDFAVLKIRNQSINPQ
jgi:hypothetical protein